MNRLGLLLLVLFALILFGSLVQAQTFTSIFSDNFNDGSIVDWDQNSGTWSAASFFLEGASLDGGAISHSVSMPSGETYKMNYRNNPNVALLNNHFFWFTSQNGFGNMNGYRVVLQTGTSRIQRMDNGVATEFFTFGGITAGSFHDVNIIHRFDGNIQVLVDGVSQGTVQDTTYRSGSLVGFATTSGAGAGRWDDINVLQSNVDVNTFQVVDEVSLVGLQATMSINDVNWPVASDGTFDVNASFSFPATINISFTGYDPRSFLFDTNAGLHEIRRLGLRNASEARNIEFQFFAPDELTILDNRFVKVIRSTVLSGRGQTNSIGNINFNLAPQDSVYDFNIAVAGTDTNTQYKYDAVTVTVNAPRNEANNNVISSPSGFNFIVGGLGLQTINGQTSFPFSTIFILGNTEDVYTLRVADNNSDGQQYFARNYILHAKGDIQTITIQPYLIDIDEGTLINLKVIDIASNIPIPDLRVTLTSGINNALVIVEDTITDAAGIAQVVMLSQKLYGIAITNQNQDTNYFSGNINADSDQLTFGINFFATDSNFTPKNIQFSIFPTSDTISGTTQKVDFNISADFTYLSVLVQAMDNNNVIQSLSSSSNPFNSNITITLADFNSDQAIIRFTVIGLDANTIITKTYIITSAGGGGMLNLVGLRNNLNPNNMLFLFVFGLMGLVFVMGQGVLGNNDSQVFVGAIGMGILVILFFREYLYYVAGALFVGAIAWMWVRVNR